MLLLLACGAGGCSGGNETDRLLADIETRFDDSVVYSVRLQSRLDSIPRSAIDNRRRQSLYDLLYTKTTVYQGIYPPDDSVLNRAVDYFKREGDRRRLVEALMLRSACYLHSRKFLNAMADAIEARDISYNMGDTLLMARVEQLLMFTFEPVYEKDSVFNHAQRSSAFYAAQGQLTNVRKMKVYSAIYMNSMGRTDEALTLVDSILRATPETDSMAIGEIYNRSIWMYVLKGDYPSAERAFRNASRYFERRSLDNIDWRYVLSMFYGAGEIDSVEHYLPVMREHCLTGDGNDFYFRYRQLVAEKRGDYKGAYDNLRRYDSIQTGRHDVVITQSPAIVTSGYYNQKAVQERQRVQARNSVIAIISVSSLIVVSLLIIVIILQRQRQRVRELNTLMEIADLKTQLDSNYIDRRVAEQWFKSGFEALDKLAKEYFAVSFIGRAAPEMLFRNITARLEQFKSRQSLDNLVEKVDRLHNGLLTEVSADVQRLKRGDIHFIALRVAGFSPKSICFFLGITPTNYYTRWQRIRRRMEDGATASVHKLFQILAIE